MISFFGVLGIVLTFFSAFVTCLYQSTHNDSTYKTKIKPYLYGLFKRNRLYRCEYSSCKRYFRRYQADLMAMKHGYHPCPHCMNALTYHGYRYDYNNHVVKPDDWTNTHRDCFKITTRQFLKLRKSVKEIHAYQQAEATNTRFEEYEKRNPDTTWMDNLQKVKGSKWYD